MKEQNTHLHRPFRKGGSTYERLRLRIRAGLPGSIAIAMVVAYFAHYYLHHWAYLTAYIVVQIITIIRILIAIQMNLAMNHLNPSRGIVEVAEYMDRFELLQRWNRRYTLYVKLPLTVCIVPLIAPPLGYDLFANQQFVYIWAGASAILIVSNAVVTTKSFRRLEHQIADMRINTEQ